MPWREKNTIVVLIAGGNGFHETTKKMSETHNLLRVLLMYFPRNWEFGSALSKLPNFGGDFEPPSLAKSVLH